MPYDAHSKQTVIAYWLRKAAEAMASSRSEFQANRLDFAVNRAYYACFYAASAVLLSMDKQFVKHSGLRSAIHRDLIKAKLLSPNWGKVFDRIFENRQAADYLMMWQGAPEQVEQIIQDADGFVQQMHRLLE